LFQKEGKVMAESKFRGNEIEYDGKEWKYKDTGAPTIGTVRPCGNCGSNPTKEGHDGCLGELKGLMNACCGHGDEREAYVQFLDGTVISGKDAVIIQCILKKYK
jgi:hypothetical protein